MTKESYSDSIRKVVAENNIEVATIAKLKELVLIHRQKHSLLQPDDFELVSIGRTDKRYEQRTRSALTTLRHNGEAALIGRGKYRFFI